MATSLRTAPSLYLNAMTSWDLPAYQIPAVEGSPIHLSAAGYGLNVAIDDLEWVYFENPYGGTTHHLESG